MGDSTISLFWVSSEHKKLSLFPRNRVLQILRGTSLDCLFHVKSESNPSDLGTRPNKVTIQQVSPGSRWISGEKWMTWPISEAIDKNILKHVRELRMQQEEEQIFNEGCIFDKAPEILTQGHAVNEKRVSKLEQRSVYSNYLIVPTKFRFRKLIRIYSYVMCFVHKLKSAVRQTKSGIYGTIESEKLTFSLFHVNQLLTSPETSAQSESPQSLLSFYSQYTPQDNRSDRFTLSQTDRTTSLPQPTDRYINLALCYLFRKATAEVKKFNSKLSIEKISVEKEGVLFSTGRMVQGMKFIQAGGLEVTDLEPLGINSWSPILDRYSPLSYCIAQHVHWCLASHRGPETCYRLSLQHCFIMQGLPLFTELQNECIRCKKFKKKFIEQMMSPVSEHQITVAPPHWATQVDLFGPITLYVPGRERETRKNPVMTYKAWVLVLICPVTKLINLQVCEKSDASGIIDAFTRMFCESGVPKVILCDEGSASIKGLKNAEIDIRNLEHEIITEYGTFFQNCSCKWA